MKRLLCLLLLIWPAPAYASTLYESDNLEFKLGGYYKNLFFTSEEIGTNDRFYGDLNRLRTDWDLIFFKNYSIKIIWDNEIIAGDFVNTPEFQAQRDDRLRGFLDLDWKIAQTESFYYGQRLYRAYFKIDLYPVIFIAGEQRVDWGVMRLLSPIDLFTQLTAFQIERFERPGVAAGNLIIAATPNLKINPVYAVDTEFDKSRMGLRITQTVDNFDISALGGRFLTDYVVGADFSGDIEGVGLRGEAFYDWTDITDNFIQAAFGIDYAFQNTFYLNFEYFYNQQSGPQPLPIAVLPDTANQIKSIHHHFLGTQFSYDITPLWIISLLNEWDLAGMSFFISPALEYSPLDWLVLTGGAQVLFGKAGGEFTNLPDIYYFQAQLFF